VKRVNVRIVSRQHRDGIVHRAFTCQPNLFGDTRRTYCEEGATEAEDTDDAVTCLDCMRKVPQLEAWPVNHEEQAAAGMGITTGGSQTT
jgi:hypothetical protein